MRQEHTIFTITNNIKNVNEWGPNKNNNINTVQDIINNVIKVIIYICMYLVL